MWEYKQIDLEQPSDISQYLYLLNDPNKEGWVLYETLTDLKGNKTAYFKRFIPLVKK